MGEPEHLVLSLAQLDRRRFGKTGGLKLSRPRRHIVMLTNAVAPDKLGGLERYVRELAGALVNEGLAVTVLAKQTSPDQRLRETGDDGVGLIRYVVPPKTNPLFALLYPLHVARAVLREVGSLEGGLIHGHYPVPALVPAMKAWPFVQTFHAPVHKEILPERQGTYVLPAAAQKLAVASVRQLERHVVRSADAVIVLSEFMRGQVAALDAAAGERCHLIPGGIDTEFFQPGHPQPHPWASGGNPLLVTARRLTPRTGVSELVEAMPNVVSALPGAKLVILGVGGQSSRIAERISQLGLQEHVVMMGRVSDVDLRDWYLRATLVVMPTRELEGFGLTTAEALACGSPVIVTPVGANKELISALDPRFVSTSATPQALADAIISVSKDTALLRGAGSRARSLAHPRYSWPAVAASHMEIYSQSGLHISA